MLQSNEKFSMTALHLFSQKILLATSALVMLLVMGEGVAYAQANSTYSSYADCMSSLPQYYSTQTGRAVNNLTADDQRLIQQECLNRFPGGGATTSSPSVSPSMTSSSTPSSTSSASPSTEPTTKSSSEASSLPKSPVTDPNATNPYAQLGANGFDTRPAAPPAFTVPVYPSIEAYVVMVINFLLDFLALGVLVMLIYGGYMYTTAMGDSGKQKKAKGIITSSIVGFFLVIVSFAVVATIIAATRPGVNECATPQSGVCISSSGGNVNFGVGTGIGSLLGNIL